MSVVGQPDQKWTFQLTQTGPGTTPNANVIQIPAWINEMSVGLSLAGITAGVEISLSDIDQVLAGTGIWFLWDPGQVTAPTLRGLVGPATALRINQTVGAGTSTLLACGQRPRV